MRKFGFLMLLFLFAGCARLVKMPVHGDAAFTQCHDGKCVLDMSFAADSILAIEGAEKAKTIYFAGNIFLIGNGFSNLWIGEIDDEFVQFKKRHLDGAPIMVSTFDWESGLLAIKWKSNDERMFKLLVDSKGKIMEEK